MDVSELKSLVSSKTRQNGFKVVERDAHKALVKYLKNDPSPSSSLQAILEQIRKDCKPGNTLGKANVQMVLSLLSESTINSNIHTHGATPNIHQFLEEKSTSMINIVNAFECPKLVFNEVKKSFTWEKKKRYNLFGASSDKANMYRDRLTILKQRVEHCKLFEEAVSLTPIEALKGNSGKKKVIGMITKRESSHDSIYLEDLNSNMKLDLSKAKIDVGMLCEGCFVIVMGEFDTAKSIFYVEAMVLPPIESRKQQEQIIPSTFHTVQNLQKEQEEKESFVVVLSDIWLDKPQVKEHLKRVFEGFQQQPPTLFILMGSFWSRPFQNISSSQQKDEDRELYTKNFTLLGDLISTQFPSLLRTKNGEPLTRFVLIPGPNDPSPSGNTLPQSQLMNIFVKGFIDRVGSKHVIVSTNPSRLQYYSKEIVLFRYDLQQRMKRYCSIPPSSNYSAQDHLISTIVNNGHLCPLPISVQPLHWQYDHSLQLYPLPHTVIIADKSEQFEIKKEDYLCLNPSSFPVDYSFIVFKPITGEVLWQKVPAQY